MLSITSENVLDFVRQEAPNHRGSMHILRRNFATQTLTRWMEEGRNFGQFLPYLSAHMGITGYHRPVIKRLLKSYSDKLV